MRGCSGGSVHGFILGVFMVLFGGVRGFIQGAGRVWFYSGGMHGFIWGGHAWFYSGGMHGIFSFFGYNEIRSMSRRYASYWNAFLFYWADFCTGSGNWAGQEVKRHNMK